MTQVPDIVFLKAFNKAWNDHDIEALMSFMADDCSFHAVGGPDLLGKSFMGRDAVREVPSLMQPGLMVIILLLATVVFLNPRLLARSRMVRASRRAWLMFLLSKMERYWLKTHFVKTGHLFLLNEC